MTFQLAATGCSFKWSLTHSVMDLFALAEETNLLNLSSHRSWRTVKLTFILDDIDKSLNFFSSGSFKDLKHRPSTLERCTSTSSTTSSAASRSASTSVRNATRPSRSETRSSFTATSSTARTRSRKSQTSGSCSTDHEAPI